MEFANHHIGFDDYAAGRIRYHAGRLSSATGFGFVDAEDIEQDLTLDLIRRLPRFDPARAALPTFIACVVRNCAETRRERARAEKRGGSIAHCSLHDTVPSEDNGEPLLLIDTLDASTGLWSCEDATWDVHSDIRIDVSRAVSRLPGPLATLAERLASETVLEISRSSGPSRDAIYRAIRRLREAFTEAGLDFYLRPIPTDSSSFR